jgi:hypothetical protein
MFNNNNQSNNQSNNNQRNNNQSNNNQSNNNQRNNNQRNNNESSNNESGGVEGVKRIMGGQEQRFTNTSNPVSTNDSLALVIISILHIIVILFVLITPFTNYNYFLFMHAIIVPFIMLHWYLNNNTCSLTIAEKEIRKRMNGGNNEVDDDECYTYKFIAPIYDFNKNHEEYSQFIYLLTTGLWFVTLYKLYTKFSDGSIKSITDLLS